MMKSLEPIGVDRWAIELNLKHGIRDLFGCPMGGRWIFAYWSAKDHAAPAGSTRPALPGGCFRDHTTEKLAPPFTGRLGKGANLTPRELSVLRSLSLGYRVAEISRDLGLGEETVRSHIEKAQTKLNVRNPMHAVAQAMRMRLIP